VSLNHLLAKLLHGIRLTFLSGKLASLHLVHIAHCSLLNKIGCAGRTAPG
jgi:hypothetical protein